jgi:hypothetical protein
MELMNIKLGNVISDILGKSGQDIISAIIKGERNAKTLASLADYRCKASPEEIEKSLVANWDENLLFMLEQSFNLYNYIQKQMIETENKIEALILQYKASLPEEQVHKNPCKRCDKPDTSKNKIIIDIEQYAHQFWGVNLMNVPGIKKGTLLRLLAELGHDFVSKFDSYKEFCRWANVVPNNKISGGKVLSSKVPKRKNHVGQALRIAANSLKNEKSPMGNYFRKIQARKGYLSAIVATANKIGRIIYTMVKNQTEYNGASEQEQQVKILKRKLARTQKELTKLQEQIKDCSIETSAA